MFIKPIECENKNETTLMRHLQTSNRNQSRREMLDEWLQRIRCENQFVRHRYSYHYDGRNCCLMNYLEEN